MRTDAPAAPRATEPNPRRLPAASAGLQQPSTPADSFAALLLAADDSPAHSPLPSGTPHPAVESTAPASQAPTPTVPLGQIVPHLPNPAEQPSGPNDTEGAASGKASPAAAQAQSESPGVSTVSNAHTQAPHWAAPTTRTELATDPNGTEGAASGKASPAAAQPQHESPWVSTVSKAHAQAPHLAAPTILAELATDPNGTEGAASGKASPAAAQPQSASPWVSTVAKARAQAPHWAAPTAPTELAPGPAGQAGQAGLYPRSAAALAWSPYSAGTGSAGGPGTAAAVPGVPDDFDAGASVALSVGARAESSAREGSGQGARGGDASRTLLESPSASGSGTDATKADADFSHLLEQATAPGLDAVWEPLGQQISLWLAGQVKKASLLLHEGMRQTLEIELKLDGKQAHLDFLTDDEQLRESLRSQAQEALSELLGQNGLELVGLSIGSRASGQSDRSTAQRPQVSSARSEGTDTAVDQPSVVLQPTAGRAGLSVYA